MTPDQEEWFAAQPEEIQALFLEFPPRTVFRVDEEIWYLVGYRTGDLLVVSAFDPRMEYSKAVSGTNQHIICASDCRSSEN